MRPSTHLEMDGIETCNFAEFPCDHRTMTFSRVHFKAHQHNAGVGTRIHKLFQCIALCLKIGIEPPKIFFVVTSLSEFMAYRLRSTKLPLVRVTNSSPFKRRRQQGFGEALATRQGKLADIDDEFDPGVVQAI